MKRTANWSFANQTCSLVSMLGLPCSPIHQNERAPKTATAVSAAALVLKDWRTSVQTIGQPLVHARFGSRFERGELSFPGAVEVVGGEPPIECRFADLGPQGTEVGQRGVAGFGS